MCFRVTELGRHQLLSRQKEFASSFSTLVVVVPPNKLSPIKIQKQQDDKDDGFIILLQQHSPPSLPNPRHLIPHTIGYSNWCDLPNRANLLHTVITPTNLPIARWAMEEIASLYGTPAGVLSTHDSIDVSWYERLVLLAMDGGQYYY